MLSGCVHPIEVPQLLPTECDGLAPVYPGRVHVRTDAIQRPLDYTWLVHEYVIEEAIVETIRRTRLFGSTGSAKTSDYELRVRARQDSPALAAGVVVSVYSEWTLTDRRTGSALVEEAVQSEGSASVGEALFAGTRLRLAMERAIRSNICDGLRRVEASAARVR